MDIPRKPQSPAPRRPKKKRSANEERQAAALAKIAKNFKKVQVDQRQRGPQFLVVLLALLGAALMLYKMFGPEIWKDESLEIAVAPDESTAEVRSVPIDSRRFRQSIEAFERPLLGEASSPNLEILADQILRTGRSLSSELQLDSENTTSRLAAQTLQASLKKLADQDSPRLEDFARLREAWLALRRQSFLAADFFEMATGSIADDHLTLAIYRDQVDSLDRALSSAFDRVSALSRDPEPGETPEDRQRQREAIEEVARELRQELALLKSRQPARPTGNFSPNLMVAIQSLEQALAEARNLAGNTNSLTPAGRPSFAPVLALINRTRVSLDELER